MQNIKLFLNRRALLAGGMILFSAALVAGLTGAFFSDTETSSNNVFQADTLDLEVGINSESTLGKLSLASLDGNEALFNFEGLTPGDTDGGFFKLRANQDAWACMAAEITGTPENDRLSPEAKAGDTTPGVNKGELQNFMQLATWIDVDEDGIYSDTVDTELVVMDLTSFDGSWMTLMDSANATNLDKDVRGEVGFQYCFGEFSDMTDPSLGCNGANPDTNQAQSDAVEMTMKFIGMQHSNNPTFVCGSLNPVTVTSADTWSGAESGKKLFAKARSNNIANFEVAVGDNDSSATGQDTDDATWVSGQTESFTLTYDEITGDATWEVAGQPVTTFNIGASAFGVGSNIGLNLKARETGSTLNVSNLVLQGAGALSTDTLGTNDTFSVRSLTLEDLDLTGGFTLTGDFVMTWSTLPSNPENLALQISVN